MRIKFGTYSFKIKSYSVQDLGLYGVENFTFNIYQKVFHFMYIPIFPVEKHWKIKDRETKKEVVDTTPEIRTAINMKMLKNRSPIWSYSGTLILSLPILFLLGYAVFGAVDITVENIDKILDKKNRISTKEDLVRLPKIDDVYTFKIIEVNAVTDMHGNIAKYEPNPYFSPEKIDYSVDYISKDSVGFNFVEDQGHLIYGDDVKKEFKLPKKELIPAVNGYRDLNVLKFPNKEKDKRKMLSGIFEIQRQENIDN